MITFHFQNTLRLKSYNKLHTNLQKNIHKKKTSISIQSSGKTPSQFKMLDVQNSP